MNLRVIENGNYFFGFPSSWFENLSNYRELENYLEIGFSGADGGRIFINGKANSYFDRRNYSFISLIDKFKFISLNPNNDLPVPHNVEKTKGNRTSIKPLSAFPSGKIVLSLSDPREPHKGIEIIFYIENGLKITVGGRTTLEINRTYTEKELNNGCVIFRTWDELNKEGLQVTFPLFDWLKRMGFVSADTTVTTTKNELKIDLVQFYEPKKETRNFSCGDITWNAQTIQDPSFQDKVKLLHFDIEFVIGGTKQNLIFRVSSLDFICNIMGMGKRYRNG